ncbi:MAG: metalloregulator ArsR/SmtB family transcription factor [Pedobacter sp.]|nr:metalloregulator ArsR/SmtB family transcription factor [Pedobacter sp.]MDQ8053847.1 metalloregulator ArsR/SmtB family transcription factor [Pedobacter sp.]
MAAAARRDVFQAIADPVRREILGLIAFEPMNLNAIAEKFDISRPAISNHIKILSECGMVSITQQGRERYCEAKLDPLGEVNQWIDQYSQFWSRRFDSLNSYINKVQHQNKQK